MTGFSSARLRDQNGEFSVSGRGNGLISSVVDAVSSALNIDLEIRDYSEHALGSGKDADCSGLCRMPG